MAPPPEGRATKTIPGSGEGSLKDWDSGDKGPDEGTNGPDDGAEDQEGDEDPGSTSSRFHISDPPPILSRIPLPAQGCSLILAIPPGTTQIKDPCSKSEWCTIRCNPGKVNCHLFCQALLTHAQHKSPTVSTQWHLGPTKSQASGAGSLIANSTLENVTPEKPPSSKISSTKTLGLVYEP